MMFLAAVLGAACIGGVAASETRQMIKTQDIGIRDPFILPVVEEKMYYMYCTTWVEGDGGPSFGTYMSKDLKEWEGPFKVFRGGPGFYGTHTYWAPEVHRYKGKYYLFGTFGADNVLRACQILVSDSPRGPFNPLTDKPVTPEGWQCLDATLFVDNDRKPWIVFCHEWEQVHDGTICAQRLTDDLKLPAGEPITLFRASEAPWATPISEGNYVTDGCFLHRTKDGKLLMLWSSFGKGGYTQAIARSESGKITGPWRHDPTPIYAQDGGHGMVFRTFQGKLMLVLHTPNSGPSRAKFIPIREKDGGLVAE
jgi:arabinan endo-1,5-alpha-L-arabinosidase